MQTKQRLYALGLVALGLLTPSPGEDSAFAAGPRAAGGGYRAGYSQPRRSVGYQYRSRRSYSSGYNKGRRYYAGSRSRARRSTPVARAKTAPAPVNGGNLVTEVRVASDALGTRIMITGTKPFTPQVRVMGRPSATIIQMPGTLTANGGRGTQSVGKNNVYNVKYTQFAHRPSPKVSVVANTRSGLTATKQSSPDKLRWEIMLWAPGVKPVALAPVASPAKGAAAAVAAAPVANPVSVKLVAVKPVAPIVVAEKTAAPRVQVAAVTTTSVSAPAASAKVALNLPAVATTPAPNRAAPALQPKAAPEKKVSLAVPSPSATSRVAFAGSRTTRSAGTRTVAAQDARVSLDFVAADINDVLKALSMQSGTNIVTGADVKGTITVSLSRVSLTEALDMVTRLSGFTYAKFGATYVVGTPASVAAITGGNQVAEPVVTEFIPYRYTNTVNLHRAVTDRFPELKLPAPAAGDKTESGTSPAINKMLVVSGAARRVSEVRGFVEKMEQAVAIPVVGLSTEVYKVRYASPSDLYGILTQLVPTVQVQLGPGQGFTPMVGQSAGGAQAGASGGSTGGGLGAASGLGAAGGGQSAGGAQGGASGGSSAGGAGTQNLPGAMPTILILTGAPTDIARARQILDEIDVRATQIVFEARVMDVGSTDLARIGVTYDFTRAIQIGEKDPGTAPAAGIVNAPTVNTSPARPMPFGAILRTPYSIVTQLDLLASNNQARLLASPNIAALDNQPASVFIGDQVRYVESQSVVPNTGQIIIATGLVEAGIKLNVQGKSSPDGSITLAVRPEVSVISAFIPAGNGGSLPQTASRYVDTVVRVKDGETIAIGGLIRESDITNVQKVPFLGDLPFFGQLFRRTEKNKQRSEIVVFITCRVLKD